MERMEIFSNISNIMQQNLLRAMYTYTHTYTFIIHTKNAAVLSLVFQRPEQ